MEGVLPPAPPFLIVCSKYIPGQNVKYLCKIAKFFACQRLGRRSCQRDIEMSIYLFGCQTGIHIFPTKTLFYLLLFLKGWIIRWIPHGVVKYEIKALYQP